MKPITITKRIDVTNEALISTPGLVNEVKNRVTSRLADYLIGHMHEGEFVISVTDVVIESAPYSAWEMSRFSQRIKMTPLVRCKDCKHREIYETCDNKTHKECELDTGDPWELGRKAYDDNWFCADGERREDE